MAVLFGSVFVGTTAVQGKVLKVPIEMLRAYDFSAMNPGYFWIEDGVRHQRDASNKFNFVDGPVDGFLISYIDVLNTVIDTGLGVGSGWNELDGIWVGEDQFEGLPIYWYGQAGFRFEGNFFYGWANGHGTLGDYKIHFKGDFTLAFVPNPPYFGALIFGELTLHL